MWKYQHPDFALFLLGELQKQQQGSIFCDTLLQTEGVCVPAHSCVLAALSPVFSRILSTSPAPHAGQNRLLSLEAVGSHALLKLVGFLYSGEMEIESRSEHEEVMAAAHRLGLRNLLEKRRVWIDRGVVAVESYWKETGIQTEDGVKSQESEMVSEPLKIQSSTDPVTSVQPCVLLEPDLPPPQLLDEAGPTRGFNLNSDVTVDMTEASNHHNKKAKKRWKMAKRESQLKKLTPQQNQIELGAESTQTGVVEKSRNVSGKDFQRLLEADKNTTAEQKEAKLDQFKVRIKLSRRSGAGWESNLLVSLQSESEKKPEEPEGFGSRTPSCPSSTLPGQNRGILTPPTDLPISPSNSSTHTSSDKSLHTPHPISVSAPVDIPSLSSSPPQADESDEHIAMLLEEMFMMGLNILPLVPLDRNLNEPDQLGSLQEQKGGQRDTESSTQSCEPELRDSDVSKTTTAVESPEQRDEDHSAFHNQSRSNTVELLTRSPEQDNLNQVQNLATVFRNFSPSFRERFILTPKATAFPDSVAAGVMPSFMFHDDRPDFMLKCLSPIESEKEDSDVTSKQEPSEPSHRQDYETQNFPLWLSESPVILDFPLYSMIDSSYPHPQCDLNACQNRSCPDLAEMQELKTSCSQNDLISGSSVQPDVSNASEHPKRRKTRKRRLATQSSNVKGDTEHRNLENEDQAKPRISGCDEPYCVNIETSNSNTYGVSTRTTNANTRAGVKRRRDVSSPLRRKLPPLNTASKQHDHVDILAQPKRTGVVKRGRGRKPKSKNNPVARLCNNAKNMPTSGQDDCDVEKTKMDNEIEQDKEEQNTQQEKDSNEMEAVDINRNCTQAMPNSYLRYAGQVKGPTILDQIFHQALPSVANPPCMRSNIRITSSLRGKSFNCQKFQGGKSEDVNSELVMNNSEQINKGICGEKKAEMSVLINEKEDAELVDNHVRPLFSCEDMPDNGKYSKTVKDRNISMEEDSIKAATILQNGDFRNKMGKEIQNIATEVSALFTSEEDMIKDVIKPVQDIDNADHELSPRKTEYVVTTNELTVMEGIEMNFCLNPDSTQAEHFRDEQNSEATSSNEHSFEMTSSRDKENKIQAALDVDTQDIGWVADCLENNEKEDLSRNKENQMIENMLREETEIGRTHEFAVENALIDANEGRWETTNGLDDGDDINVERSQYSAEMIDGQTLLEEEELSQGQILSTEIAVDPSKGACPPEMLSTDSPVQAEGSSIHSPNVYSGEVSTVLSVGVDSGSKDDCHLDEEDVEVDVVGDFVEEFPLGLLAARQAVILPIEGLLDQEDELATTEEEEVDVTGEDTE